MSLDFHVIIPARYQSSRLPGKLLMDIHGQTVIERVYRQALQSQAASVTIAVDSEQIESAAKGFGAATVMTSVEHLSGTDRLAEVVAKLNFPADAIIVNVQGDEPFIPPALINQVAASLIHSSAPMATLCCPIEHSDLLTNPNVVKVVRDQHDHALYFSRSAIPAHRDHPGDIDQVFRHIGLYAYRAAFLLEIVSWPICKLESIEMLEQLRVLWSGYRIKVTQACVRPLQDINTAEDLELARTSELGTA